MLSYLFHLVLSDNVVPQWPGVRAYHLAQLRIANPLIFLLGVDYGQSRTTRIWRHNRRCMAIYVRAIFVTRAQVVVDEDINSYDTCDIGTYPNQTRKDGTPTTNAIGGTKKYDYQLSVLSGQKLSWVPFRFVAVAWID